MTSTGHLEGLGNEVDMLGDLTLDIPFKREIFDKTLDEIIRECDYPEVTKTLNDLKARLKNEKLEDYWQIIRNFSDDMPCDCGECQGLE